MSLKVKMMPIISKAYCSSSPVVLVVRSRPRMVNGGGFVVTDFGQKVVFKVEGCGVLGKKDELILKDGDGDALLLIRRKGGLVEALSIHRQWKGYSLNYERSQKTVFCLKEPNSCLVNNGTIRISVDANNNRDFEIKGHFLDRECSIVDNKGNVIAQVGVKEVMASNDLYHVTVKPGIDQAFVFGVIAVLDYIYDGTTRC